MFVVSVAPIARGAFKEKLSFFSKKAIAVGSLVHAPIRGKKTPVFVLENVAVQDSKLSLRNSSYALKKIETTTGKKIISKKVMDAFAFSARYHALPLGTMVAHHIPNALLSEPEQLHTEVVEPQGDETKIDTVAFQAAYEERVRMYRNIVRGAFAKNESVFIMTPTIAEAEHLREKLERGIHEQVVVLTSALTKKRTISLWKEIIADTKPYLIIGTRSFISLPNKKFDSIIVERETARAYVQHKAPFIDSRIVAEAVARHSGARCILADFPIRIQTRLRLEEAEIEELSRLQVSSRTSNRTLVVDARTKKDEEKTTPKKKRFSVLTEKARLQITHELEHGGRVFLYASRRGLAPVTVCNDCGTPVIDEATGTPMTLHKTTAGNVFLSHRSGAVVKANISCASCGGWNLVSLGIGVDRVYEEITKIFPEHEIHLLTADTASTHTKAKKIRDAFYSKSGSILIGIDRSLPYLHEPVETSVVVSIDSLLSLSAWRAHEYALNTLFYIRENTQNNCIIQTRQPDTLVMKSIATGNPTEFIMEEMRDRKTYHYPPYTTFISLSWHGTERQVEKNGERVQEILSDYDAIGPLPGRHIGKNVFVGKIVVRLPRHTWPDTQLLSRIMPLQPDITITVDPDEIV